MKLRVECYSGYKADERPVRFYLGNRKLEVTELVDRWYGEDHEYFKLLADDGNRYVLKYQRPENRWDLIEYSVPDLPGWVEEKVFEMVRVRKKRRGSKRK
jgi:hypothetical protein